MSNVYLICGAAGSGKSPFVRKLIGKDKRCLIFDVRDEYGQRTKYAGQEAMNIPTNTALMRSRYVGRDMGAFIKLCDKKKDTICVFEEATMFFEGKTMAEMRMILTDRFHTRNTYCLLFHSINAIPPRMMELSNYLVLFKTNDEEATVKRKFLKILPHFSHLQNSEKGASLIIELI
jgi:hypothetical protein